MPDTDRIKDTLEHEIEALHQAREELLFAAQIDHLELRTHWDQLDDALRFAQQEINRLGDRSEEAEREIEASSRKLLQDIRRRLDQLRTATERARGTP